MQLHPNPNSSLVVYKNRELATYKSRRSISRKKWQSFIKVTLGAVFLVLILALPAIACGPGRGVLFASNVFLLPAVASISSYGIPLLAIICIEAFILHKRESLPYLKAFGIALGGNIFYLIASLFSSVFLVVIFPLAVIGGAISAAMCLSFCQRVGFLKNLSKAMFAFLVYLLFVGMGVAQVFIMVSMNISAGFTYLYAATAGLLLIGFIFGFVMKGYAIARLLKHKSPSLAATVMSMQVGSYPVVAIAYYFMAGKTF
ncbi:hypothetical protein [Microseira wollei]|uniref:Uncharacterized protein n=1 Tax=Microseira wollei NIES-4236 TaxID=2530354 RepID=A0AAV3XP87_9CYAN|nr:hypothetical protein [Microseira wollei]GET41397.1 hypothetical protein MiSe_62090 [Microseira wollei NIES-4236]